MLGNKQFELSNLPIAIGIGNVLTTVSDRKIPHTSDNITIDYYTSDITSAQDYYAFGQLMPGRNVSSNEYKFGFNGKEKDDEVKGSGNSYDFGARIYDSRIGRWLACDPLAIKYPALSPYQFCANNPILFIDPDGKVIKVAFEGGGREAFIKLINSIYNEKVLLEEVTDVMGYTTIKLVYKEGYTSKDLSPSQLKSLENINKIAESKNVINTTISDNNEKEIWIDSFNDKEMKADEISEVPNVDYQLAYVFHFFAEQYNGQFPGSDFKDEDFKFDYAHEKALNQGKDVYGFTWIGVENPDNAKQWEVDFIDKDNKYLNTLRVNQNDDGTYTYTSYNRAEKGTDYSEIDYWKGANNYGEKQEKVRKHFQETENK